MRVRARRGDERGAVLILVAVFSIVAVIFLAFVVDIGNQRQDRRQLTTATDAAALDVAQTWARNSLIPPSGFVSSGVDTWDCKALADAYLDKNREVADDAYTCEAKFINEQFASVTVAADGITNYQVGQAIGVDEGSIASSTSVRIRSTLGGGLRPFTICARDADVTDWMNAGGPANTEITLGGDKFLPEECGENNGNWGFVIFNMEQTGQKDLADIIRDGSGDPFSSFDNGDQGNAEDPYADEKAICMTDGTDSPPEPNKQYDEQDPVTCVFNDQGAAGWNNDNALDAFQYLIDEEITFSLPIYGEIQPLGPGQDTGFPIIAFAEVQMVSFNKAKPPDQKFNDVTLRFLNLSTGQCCDVNESNYVLEICDVGTTGGAVLATFDANCRTFDGSTGGGPSVPPAPQPCEVDSVTPVSQDVGVDLFGESVAPAVLTATVVNASDCDVITVDAVDGAQRVAASVGAPSGNSYPISFPAGTPFGPGGRTLVVEVLEDGVPKHNGATISTVATVLPCSNPAVSPAIQGLQVRRSDNMTDAPAAIQVEIAGVDQCGSITAEIRSGGDFRTMTGPATASALMTFTLPAGTPIPNGKHNNHDWSVRIYNDNVLISNTGPANSSVMQTQQVNR